MSLQNELGLPNPIRNPAHAAVLNIVFTGTLLSKEGTRVLRAFGLTDAQFNVLMLLKYQSSDGRANQTSLGRMLLVHRSNVTGLVDRMEEAGLVRRIPDPEDRRINQVEMTGKGTEIFDKAQKAYFARLEEVMSSLPTDRYGELCKMLESVRARLDGKGAL